MRIIHHFRMIPKEELRAVMIKKPKLKLWDKDLVKWDKSDIKKFKNIQSKGNDLNNKKIRRIASNSIKVIRISDGKIYTSIVDCKNENDFCNVTMTKELKIGINFKKLI